MSARLYLFTPLLDDAAAFAATLERALPVADLLLNERGEWSSNLHVYVDETDASERGGPACPLAGAREIRIIAALSGG